MTSEDTLAVMVAGPTADHSVVPFHALVQLFDPGVEDAIPEWTDESLELGVAAGPSGLSILTRVISSEGPKTSRVFVSACGSDEVTLRPSTLSTTTPPRAGRTHP
jgi:hypothetical protein